MHPQMAVNIPILFKQRSVLTPTFSEKTGQKQGEIECFLGENGGVGTVKLWKVAG